MIDELEEKRQRRRDTREGLIRWVKNLREYNFQADRRSWLAANEVAGVDVAAAVKRVLAACTAEDIVDMLALCAGAHQYGELANHIRSVQFVETTEQRELRLASPLAAVFSKLGDSAVAWLWDALSTVSTRAPRAGHPDVVLVVDAIFDALRPDRKTS